MESKKPHNWKPIKYAVNESGCHICTSHATDKDGYPLFSRNKKRHRMSRYIYMQTYGSFDEKLLVCHKCDNPACINPEHLFLGTAKDNAQDKACKNRCNTPSHVGSFNPKSKITEEQVKEIKLDLRKQGVIAKEYGISRCAVNDIKCGRTWTHLQ